jgi:hypothetical protein
VTTTLRFNFFLLLSPEDEGFEIRNARTKQAVELYAKVGVLSNCTVHTKGKKCSFLWVESRDEKVKWGAPYFLRNSQWWSIDVGDCPVLVLINDQDAKKKSSPSWHFQSGLPPSKSCIPCQSYQQRKHCEVKGSILNPKDITSRKPRLLIEENQIAHPVLGFCESNNDGHSLHSHDTGVDVTRTRRESWSDHAPRSTSTLLEARKLVENTKFSLSH